MVKEDIKNELRHIVNSAMSEKRKLTQVEQERMEELKQELRALQEKETEEEDPNIGNGHGWYRIIETYRSGGQVYKFTGSGWDHAIPESFILGLDPEVAPATRTPSI